MNPKAIAITKKIVSTVVGIGTAKIVAGIIENNVNTEKLTDKVSVTVASYTLGFAASEYASDFTDAKIDELLVWWDENVTNRSK